MMLQSGVKPMARAHTRPASSRVRPFTASKHAVRPVVHVRAAEVAEEAPVELAPLVLEEEEEQVERIILDDEAKMAVLVAEELMSSYTLEAVLEGSLDQNASAKGNALLENSLESNRGALASSLDVAASVLAASAEAASLDAIEDYQGAAGFRKYDEEEDAAIPEETRDTIQRVKLTRQELANLVPKDWDSVNVEWFTNKKEDNIPLPDYKLTFLWQKNNIAVAVDQVYSRGQVSPLTEYFVWPRKDAWEELKAGLEVRPSVSERDKVILLNRLTEVINFWQQEPAKPTIEQARATFPDCAFA